MAKIDVTDDSAGADEQPVKDEPKQKTKAKNEPKVIETDKTKIEVNNWEDDLDESEPLEHPVVEEGDEAESEEKPLEQEDEWHKLDEADTTSTDSDEGAEQKDSDDTTAAAAVAAAAMTSVDSEMDDTDKPSSDDEEDQAGEPESEDTAVEGDKDDVDEEGAENEPNKSDEVEEQDQADEKSESDEIETDDSIVESEVHHPDEDPANDTTDDDKVETDEDKADKEAARERAESIASVAKRDASGSRWSRFKSKIGEWWANPKIRYSFLAGLVILIGLTYLIPTVRFAVLNTFGVRASAEVVVLDSETSLPLKEVEVSINGTSVDTNSSGTATLDGIRLGNNTVTVEKSAYATYSQDVTINMGDNTLDQVALEAIGTSFDFTLVDWLSQMPVTDGEVSFETNSAFVNSEGEAVLNIPPTNDETIDVVVSAEGYKDQTVTVSTVTTEATQVSLVVDRDHFFVSKRDGTYDVYKISPDGSNEELILAGTGSERDDIRFDVSPLGAKAVLVATRDPNNQNADGFVLSGIFVIDTETGDFEQIDQSERIDIVGWIGESVIYVKVQAGASGTNPERHRLMSYNTATGESNQLAASNYFNDVLVAKDYVFYAPSDAYKQNPKPFLFRSNVTGSQVDTVFEKVVWTVFRSGFDQITFDSEQVWYEGSIDTILNNQLNNRPNSIISRLYTDSPGGESSAWVDQRDGKGVLLITNQATGEDTVLVDRGGLRNPVVWLDDDHLIFRIVTPEETADYIVSISGDSEPVKLTDVTNVSGADRWYYYY